MIVDKNQNESKPRRGIMGLLKTISSLRDLMTAWEMFYNPVISSGL